MHLLQVFFIHDRVLHSIEEIECGAYHFEQSEKQPNLRRYSRTEGEGSENTKTRDQRDQGTEVELIDIRIVILHSKLRDKVETDD